jgi:hypothetical protein
MSKDIVLCYSNNNTYPVDRNNQQELANFKQDNPHITGSSISIGTPLFCVMKAIKLRAVISAKKDLI